MIHYDVELINKIWFKEVPLPVAICYCANVTEDEILDHVAVAKKCCSSVVQSVIAKGLALRKE